MSAAPASPEPLKLDLGALAPELPDTAARFLARWHAAPERAGAAGLILARLPDGSTRSAEHPTNPPAPEMAALERWLARLDAALPTRWPLALSVAPDRDRAALATLARLLAAQRRPARAQMQIDPARLDARLDTGAQARAARRRAADILAPAGAAGPEAVVPLTPDLTAAATPALHAELTALGVARVRLAWHPDRAQGRGWHDMLAGLAAWHRLWLAEGGYDLAFGYMLAGQQRATAGADLPALARRLTVQLTRHLRLTATGRIEGALTGGFGQLVALPEALGFPALGDVETGIIPGAPERLARAVLRRFQRDRDCAACRFLGTCASSGLAAAWPLLADEAAPARRKPAAGALGVQPVMAEIEAAASALGARHRAEAGRMACEAGPAAHG